MPLTRKPDGVLGTILQPREPVGQGLSVIGDESLEVPVGEASTLERCEDPREAQRRRVREHMAFAERSGFRIGVTPARDAEVEETPAGSEWIRVLLRVEIDLDATDVLNDAMLATGSKALAGELSIID